MKMQMSDNRKIVAILLLVLAATLTVGAQDARKEITESYNVSKGATLSSDTKYTQVEILNWDQDVVDILAVVEVDASSKARAEELLEKIDVEIGKSGNTVSLETDLAEGWSRNAKVTIKVTVKAPAYVNLNVENSYGDLYVQEVSGLVLMDLKYSNLKADKLSRGNDNPVSQLELAYSNGTIGEANKLNLELAYSDLEVNLSRMIQMESKYSKLSGERAGTIITEGAYDKYFLDELDAFEAELKYSGLKFGQLNKSLSLESGYTNVKIENLPSGFDEISAELSYGNIEIKPDPSASYEFKGESKYGKVSVARGDKLSRSKENNYVEVWGNVGSNPRSSMHLVAKYGNIDIL